MDVWARRGHFYLCLSLGERDTHFVALRRSMATCILRVDGLSTDPQVLGVTEVECCFYYFHIGAKGSFVVT